MVIDPNIPKKRRDSPGESLPYYVRYARSIRGLKWTFTVMDVLTSFKVSFPRIKGWPRIRRGKPFLGPQLTKPTPEAKEAAEKAAWDQVKGIFYRLIEYGELKQKTVAELCWEGGLNPEHLIAQSGKFDPALPKVIELFMFLAHHSELSIEWLLLGQGTMMADQQAQLNKEEIHALHEEMESLLKFSAEKDRVIKDYKRLYGELPTVR